MLWGRYLHYEGHPFCNESCSDFVIDILQGHHIVQMFLAGVGKPFVPHEVIFVVFACACWQPLRARGHTHTQGMNALPFSTS